MSNKINQITVGSAKIIQLDTDPSTGVGYDAHLGSLAITMDTGKLYVKVGLMDTDWELTTKQVHEYSALASFPATGVAEHIYVDTTTKKIYHWNGSAYAELSSSAGSAISVSDEGSVITSGVTSFNFVGSGVSATASGADVTVTISGGGSSGANTTLSNLTTPTSINQDLLPSNSINIGANTTPFNNTYFKTLFLTDGTNTLGKLFNDSVNGAIGLTTTGYNKAIRLVADQAIKLITDTNANKEITIFPNYNNGSTLTANTTGGSINLSTQTSQGASGQSGDINIQTGANITDSSKGGTINLLGSKDIILTVPRVTGGIYLGAKSVFPVDTNATDLGSSSVAFKTIYANTGVQVGDASGGNSVTLSYTGLTTNIASNQLLITTVNGGVSNSGDIWLKTGTSSATQGNIKLTGTNIQLLATGYIDANSKLISNVSNPSALTDASNRYWVDRDGGAVAYAADGTPLTASVGEKKILYNSGSTTTTITMPVATLLPYGTRFTVINGTGGATLNVVNSASTAIMTIPWGYRGDIVLTNPATNAWVGMPSVIKSGIENDVALGSGTAIDWTLGTSFYKIISGTTAFTYSNPLPGRSIRLLVINSTGGPLTVSFPAGYKSPSGLSLSTNGGGQSSIYQISYYAGAYYITSQNNFSA